MSKCIEEGLKYSNHFFNPFGGWVMHSARAERWHQKNPTSFRVAVITINALVGLIKPFLVPLIAAVGTVALPILAGIKGWQGHKEEAKRWLAAWAFSVIALVGLGAFVAVSGFYMTFLQGAACVAAGCALSIIIHVHRVSYTNHHGSEENKT